MIGHEVLHELLLLVGHQPGKVGLVLGIDASHQLDIGSEALTADAPAFHLLGSGLVGQVAVPGPAEVAITPCPLLLARRLVVAGHVQHTVPGVVLIATLEVVFRIDSHIARGDGDVLIVRDVDACRIVHFIIGTRSNGERRHGSLAMIEHGIDIRRKHTLVGIVHLHGGIGPPEEGLRQRRTVRHATLNLQIGTAGTQRETSHPLLVEHALHLVHPHRHGAVLVLNDGGIDGHKGRWTMVLGPVELDAARYPGTRQSDECRLDDMVVIDEVALPQLVVGHLDATAQLRQYHDLDILILQVDGLPVFVYFLVTNRLDDGVRIHHTTRALIDPLLQEHRILLRFACLIGRNGYNFPPSFYHNDII